MLIITASDCRTLKGESAFDLRGGGHARIEIEPPMAEWCNGSISESLSDDPSSSLGAASTAMSCRVHTLVKSMRALHGVFVGKPIEQPYRR